MDEYRYTVWFRIQSHNPLHSGCRYVNGFQTTHHIMASLPAIRGEATIPPASIQHCQYQPCSAPRKGVRTRALSGDNSLVGAGITFPPTPTENRLLVAMRHVIDIYSHAVQPSRHIRLHPPTDRAHYQPLRVSFVLTYMLRIGDA